MQDRISASVQDRISASETRFAVRGDRRNGIDRLSLVGELDRSTVPLLEIKLDEVAHPGGAVVLDLRDLDAVGTAGVRVLKAGARHARQADGWLFVVNCPERVRDAFESAGAGDLLSEIDVSDVLASGDGAWSPTSLPSLPRNRKRPSRRLRVVRDRP